MTYDELLLESSKDGITVLELPLKGSDGRNKGDKIAIRKDIQTLCEKGCILAEELGHYHTSVGNILDQNITENRKQEQKARLWAYDRLVGLIGIAQSYKAGCSNLHEMSNYLGVTEEFLLNAINCYKSKYGVCVKVDIYIIYFEPCLGVVELFE